MSERFALRKSFGVPWQRVHVPDGWTIVVDEDRAPYDLEEIAPTAAFENERDAELYVQFRMGLLNARIGK